MKINVHQITPTLVEAIGGFFPPAERVGHPDYRLPTTKLPFTVRLDGPDLVCDFGPLGWNSLEPDDIQRFVALENYLVGQGLLKGEVILKCTKYRVQQREQEYG